MSILNVFRRKAAPSFRANQMHDAMDDMADFAQGRTWAPYIPRGCDQQGRLTATLDQREGAHAVDTEQPMPAEACTELGAECRRERMGRVSSWERLWLRYGSHALGCFITGLVVGLAYWSRHV